MSDTRLFRVAGPEDYDALGALVYDAIHTGPTQYTPAQSRAWAPAPRYGPDWHTRLSRKYILLAEDVGTRLGFMTLEPGGYIDFAYIRPEAQRKGLFRALFERLLDRARATGETDLSTHASLMAQPAFAAMGFTVDHHETVTIDGQSLARARMIKHLE